MKTRFQTTAAAEAMGPQPPGFSTARKSWLVVILAVITSGCVGRGQLSANPATADASNTNKDVIALSRSNVLNAIGGKPYTEGLPILTAPLNWPWQGPDNYRIMRYELNPDNPFRRFHGFGGVAMGGVGGNAGRNGTLINRRTVWCASHTGPANINVFDFIKADGTHWVGTNMASHKIPGTDVTLILLHKNAPVGWDIPYLLTERVSALCTNWMPLLVKHATGQIQTTGVSVQNPPPEPLDPWSPQLSLETARYDPESGNWTAPGIGRRHAYWNVSGWLTEAVTNYSLNTVGGDSGSGGFLVVDTNLVFVGVNGGVQIGPRSPLNLRSLTLAIGTLYTNNGLVLTPADHPRELDLSPYR